MRNFGLNIGNTTGKLLAIFCLSAYPFFSAFAEPQKQTTSPSQNEKPESHNKVEDLIIWKLSDELHLSVAEEKKFSEAIRRGNEGRKSINVGIEKLVNQLQGVKSTTERKKLLTDYENLIKKHNSIQLSELQKLKSLLGDERMAQYLVLKTQISQKIKETLANPQKSQNQEAEKLLKPPKVIVE